jgi:serine/threonine protein kinase
MFFGFVAPELYLLERAHPASDVWAFGIVVYEFVTGYELIEDEDQLFGEMDAEGIEAELARHITNNVKDHMRAYM